MLNRDWISLLLSVPFRRAPILLLRYRSVFWSVAGAAAVLGFVTAVTPLFVSSAGNAAVAQEISNRCAGDVGGTVRNWSTVAESSRTVDALEASSPALQPPILSLVEQPVLIAPFDDPGNNTPVRMFHRRGFEQHVTILEQVPGDGVWMSSRASDYLGLSAGDEIAMFGSAEPLLISIVYQDLNDEPRTDFWCSYDRLFLPGPPFGDLPPPLVLVSQDKYLELFPETPGLTTTGTWEFPVELDGITLDSADSALADLEGWVDSLASESHGIPPLATDLRFITARARALTEELESSIWPVALAVILISAALVGVAASFWVDRRRAELILLLSKGVSPVAIGLKASLEMALALAAGAALGWSLALAAAPYLGPVRVIEAAARASALRAVSVALATSFVTTMMVASARATQLQRQPRPSVVRLKPVLIVATVVWVVSTAVARLVLGNGGIVVAKGSEVGAIHPLVLAFPILVFGTWLLAAVALVRWWLPRLFRRGANLGPVGFLISRRLLSNPGRVLIMGTAWALPMAVAIYAASLTATSALTIDAKASGFVGARTAVALLDDRPFPENLASSATRVLRVERLVADEMEIDVIGIDPATFEQGAFWAPSFSDLPISRVLELLDGPGGPLPAVIANSDHPITEAKVRQSDLVLEFDVQGQIEAFPGMRSKRPLVIVDRDRLRELGVQVGGRLAPGFFEYLWVQAPADDVIASFNSAGISYRFTIESGTVLDQLKYATIIWTFSYVRLMAILSALITTGAVLLYADTAQRSRSLSYALVRRMGLSRRAHLKVGFGEYSLIIGMGGLVGAIAGLSATVLVYSFVDPVPATPPSPRLAFDWAVVAASAIAGVVLASLATGVVQRAADRTDIAEVLRHAP